MKKPIATEIYEELEKGIHTLEQLKAFCSKMPNVLAYDQLRGSVLRDRLRSLATKIIQHDLWADVKQVLNPPSVKINMTQSTNGRKNDINISIEGTANGNIVIGDITLGDNIVADNITIVRTRTTTAIHEETDVTINN